MFSHAFQLGWVFSTSAFKFIETLRHDFLNSAWWVELLHSGVFCIGTERLFGLSSFIYFIASFVVKLVDGVFDGSVIYSMTRDILHILRLVLQFNTVVFDISCGLQSAKTISLHLWNFRLRHWRLLIRPLNGILRGHIFIWSDSYVTLDLFSLNCWANQGFSFFNWTCRSCIKLVWAIICNIVLSFLRYSIKSLIVRCKFFTRSWHLFGSKMCFV